MIVSKSATEKIAIVSSPPRLAPMGARDHRAVLRRIAAVLKINNDLERMADLAVDIAKQAVQLTAEQARGAVRYGGAAGRLSYDPPMAVAQTRWSRSGPKLCKNAQHSLLSR